jgi:hypothetical protein
MNRVLNLAGKANNWINHDRTEKWSRTWTIAG